MKRALILASFVALVAPASAFAHASVLKTHPTYRERLEGRRERSGCASTRA